MCNPNYVGASCTMVPSVNMSMIPPPFPSILSYFRVLSYHVFLMHNICSCGRSSYGRLDLQHNISCNFPCMFDFPPLLLLSLTYPPSPSPSSPSPLLAFLCIYTNGVQMHTVHRINYTPSPSKTLLVKFVVPNPGNV